jgi:hypothetical protein
MPDGALAPELAAFCQRGLSVCLASCDSARNPIAGPGLACRQDGTAVRVFLHRRGNESIVRAVDSGAPFAVTFSQPETHRSIQLKAGRARVAPLLPEDEPQLAHQAAAMRDELISVGYSTTFASLYCAYERQDLVAIVFVPEQAFVQTPGPEAGSALP